MDIDRICPMLGSIEANHRTSAFLSRVPVKFRKTVDYIDMFNSWLMSINHFSEETATQRYSFDGGRTYTFRVTRTVSLPKRAQSTFKEPVRITIKACSIASSKKEAVTKATYKLIAELRRVCPSARSQADDGTEATQESIQGLLDQSTDVAINTSITRDGVEEVSTALSTEGGEEVASSEPVYRFPQLTDRWMPYANFTVTTSNTRGQTLSEISIPNDLFTVAKCAPNIAPFEAFVYMNYTCEFKFVLNANKFQTGKLLLSYLSDSYGAISVGDCLAGALARPHVMIDLPSRSEAKIEVPWKYHAPFVRVVNTTETTTAVKAGQSATISLYVLSPMRVATDGLTTAYGQIFYRLKKTAFSGMSYRVSFQGDDGCTIPGNAADAAITKVLPLRTVGIVSGALESMATQLGSSSNQDKPNSPLATSVVPRPRSNFPNVRGIDDATALRSFATGMTNYHKISSAKDEPRGPLELARIWGLLSTSTWGVGDTPGTRIFDVKIDPTGRLVSSTTALTPLETSCGIFNFWSGPIEVRFDFVSTTFHQGTVMISIEFGRPVTSGVDVCATGSTYTKTFHLGDQRSCSIVVPYIFDTMYRRTSGALLRLLASQGDYPANGTDQRQSLNLTLDVHANVRMTVVNELRPIQSVSSTIDVLMFWRAGKNFSLMGLKQSDFSDALTMSSSNYIHNLPSDFYTTGADGVTSTHDAPAIHGARVQMDSGEKEDKDSTQDFSQGVAAKGIQISDDTLDFKDILRRPTMMFDRVTVNQQGVAASSNVSLGFFIPVMPPSRTWTNLTSGATNSPYDAGSIGTSPSTVVANLFRGWRGSSKYTFFFYPDSDVRYILLTYLPHSGVCKLGNISFPTVITNTSRAFSFPYKCGYATEMVVPAINPTASIVVPYESELNWTLSWETNGGSNYTWRDKGYLNAGHVVVQVFGGNSQMTCWWAAGDDYAMNMFYGPSYSFNESKNWTISETGVVGTTTSVISSEFTAWETRRSLTLGEVQGTTTTTRRKRETTATATTSAATTTAAPIDLKASFTAYLTSKGYTRAVNKYTFPPVGCSVEDFRTALWNTNRGMTQDDYNRIVTSYTTWLANLPATQSDKEDFSLSNALASAGRVIKSVTPRVAATTVVSAIPFVGPSVALGMSAGAIVDRVDNVADSLTDTSSRLAATCDTVTAKVEQLSDMVGGSLEQVQRLLQQAASGVSSVIPGIASGVTYIYNFLLDMFLAWYHSSWVVVGTAVVRLIGMAVPSMAMTGVISLGTRLGVAIGDFVRRSTEPVVQADVQLVEVIVGLLAGIAGTIVGVSMDRADISFVSRLFRRITQSSGVVYFVQTINFVKTVFVALKELVMRALGYITPEAAALKALSGKSEELAAFVRDAQQVTSESNNNMLALPGHRTKVWKTVMQACQIQRLLAEVPSNKASPVLSKLCTEVIKFGNERFVDIASCPVRFEPYVICIEGETNIGKSYMTEEVISELLLAVGYSAPVGNLAYYRQPGNDYWTGLRDQPAVVYDDWLQMNDTQSVALQLSELFQLKTPALFNPNMAHLEEKKIRANPLIVVLLCNNGFPNVSLANSPAAVFRRRDAVIRVVKRSEYKDVHVSDIPEEVTSKFGHLKFVWYKDVSKRDSRENMSQTYEEFSEQLITRFKRHHAKETVNVKKRLDRLFRVNRSVPHSLIDISDPFRVYYNSQLAVQEGFEPDDMWITSERLERDVAEVYEHMLRRASTLSEEDLTRVASEPTPQFDFGFVWSGMAMSGAMWSWIFKYVARSLSALGNELMTYQMESVGRYECTVCREEKPIYRACRAEVVRRRLGAPLLSHPVCDDCWRGVEAHSSDISCPNCRHRGRPVALVTTHELDWYTRIIVGVGRGAIKMADVVSIIQRCSESVAEFQRWFDNLGIALELMHFIGTGEPIPLERAIVMAGRTAINMATAQSDEEEQPLAREIAAAAAEARLSAVNILRTALQELNPTPVVLDAPPDPLPPGEFQDAESSRGDEDEEINRTPPPSYETPDHAITIFVHDLDQRGVRATGFVEPFCYHGYLHCVNTNTVYTRSRWEATVDNVRVIAPDCPCGPDCYWSGAGGRSNQERFYSEYAHYNAPDLRNYIHAWVNGRDSPNHRAYAVTRVPAALQPEWMFNNIADEAVNSLTETSWWESLSGVWHEYSALLRILAGVIVACGTLVAGHAAYTSWFPQASVPTTLPFVETQPVAGTLASLVTVQSAPDRTRHAPRVQVRRGGAEQQAECPSISEVVEAYILRNATTAELRQGDMVKMVFHGLGLCGHSVLIPKHYRSVLLSGKYDVWIGPVQYPTRRQLYTPSSEDFTEFTLNDILIWEWPKSTECFKDIRKFFVTEEDLSTPVPSRATLYVLPGRKATSVRAVEVELYGALASVPVRGTDDEFFDLQDVWDYNYSQTGACGSPLVRANSTRPILGVHVAGFGDGHDGRGYSIILTQDMLKKLKPNALEPPDTSTLVAVTQSEIYLGDEVQVNYVGALPPGRVPYTPHKSKLERSSIYGAEGLDVDVRPSVMSINDPAYTHNVSPLIMGAKKYGKLSIDFPTHHLRGPTTYLRDMITVMKPLVTPCKKLTVSEAVVGLPQVQYYDPMDLNTSPGYPLMLDGGTTKKDYIDVTYGVDGSPVSAEMKPKLLELYEEAFNTRSSGQRHLTIWVDTLKDEKRPTAKALKPGGTRLICNGPTEHAIAMRQSFLHFSAAFMANRTKMMHAVGINPTSYEWNYLATKLLRYADPHTRFVVTLDYSNFGPAFNGRVCAIVLDLIIEWTLANVSGISENEVRSLLAEVQNSYHACRNTVFTQNCGAPSGNQMTTVINSLVNMFYVTYAWQELVGPACLRRGKMIFEEFRRCTYLVVYGDDLIMAVNTYFDEFNAATISAFFARFSIVATDSVSKEAVVTKGVKFEEAQFLKRRFKYGSKRNVWMSQLSEDSLRATTQWVWRSANRDLSTRVNCEVSVLNAHGHGPFKFEEFRANVNKALLRRRIEPISTTWDEVDTLFYDVGYSTNY
nr:MAG: polyprotein [Iflaviridae sp.]